MKTSVMILVLAFLFAVGTALHAQVPRTLTYQGVLTDTAGTPVPNGTYSLTFRLYQTSTGGSPLWQETKNLSVERGVFSTTLGEITPLSLPFDRQYWLSIQIASNPELSPRIALTSSAYSLHTQRADTASYALTAPQQGFADSARIAGTIPNNSVNTAKLQDAAVTPTKLADNAVTTSKIQNLAVTLGKLDTSGASIGQVVTYTGGGISWQTPPAGGLSLPYSGSAATSGAAFDVSNSMFGGVAVQGTSSSTGNYGYLGSGAVGVLGSNGNGNFGYLGGSSYAVYGNATGSSTGAGVLGMGPSGNYGTLGSSSTGVYGLAMSPGGEGVVGEANSGISAHGVTGKSSSNVGVYGLNTSSNNYGYLGGPTYGVVGITYSTIDNAAGVRGEAAASGGQTIGVEGVSTNSPIGTGVVGRGRATGGYFEAFNPDGYAGVFAGKVSVNVLQINGGSDLAEPFSLEEIDEVEPGTLLVIDKKNPGSLRVSTVEYDHTVAGIVSGAGDIRAGITLGQNGVIHGNTLVAIAGRVYCKAEALSSPIEPGDLLTTSNIPGHAMKATDKERSQGAIIGKAMSRLDTGTGLVLVLVNLQ